MSSASRWRCIEAFVLLFVALMPTVLAILALEFNFWPVDSSIMIGLVLINVAGASVVLIYLEKRRRRMELASTDSESQYQDAERNDDPPDYEDVIAKAPPYENAIVEGVPRFPGAPVILTLGSGKAPDPSLCQGNRDSTLSATSNVTNSGLPSYNEALNQSFETNILLEGSSCASVHK